ncbi:GTP-binding protein [Sporosarcina sp. OR05]|uniref:CobW family GTP-binding protein n=1 Tax=Sporosarcina sp. OR05 TaxID=2969819 RepID=UPI00352AF774
MGVPVYVIGGFLGSGKTTVLQNMIAMCKSRNLRPVILLNEIGQKNVERELFGDEEVVELLDGCICCTIQDDLRDTLNGLMEKKELFDIVLIEGTGVANPMDIQEVLVSSAICQHFDLLSVITVVDASRYLDYQSVFSSSSDVRRLLQEQIMCGSLLVVNKVDALSTAELRKVRKKLDKVVASHQELVACSFGNVDEQTLYQRRIDRALFENGEQVRTHKPHRHSFVQVICLEDFPALDQRAFENWMKQLPESVLRSKGYCRFQHSDRVVSFQYASKKLTYRELEENRALSTIVLIGIELNIEQIKDQFEALAGVNC